MLRWVLKSDERPEFLLGERMQLEINSPIDGYLTLFNVEPGGRILPIFPNPHSAAMAETGAERRVHRGRRFVIPEGPIHGFELVAGEPSGDGMVVAVFTDQPLEPLPITAARQPPRPMADREEVADYIETIADLLRSSQTVGNLDRQVGWAIATAPYRTTARAAASATSER